MGSQICWELDIANASSPKKLFWDILRKEGPLLCNKEAGGRARRTEALNSPVFPRPILRYNFAMFLLEWLITSKFNTFSLTIQ